MTPDESDPVFKEFTVDPGLWKSAVLDSNVAAQQEGVNALCAFLKYGGPQACARSESRSELMPLHNIELSQIIGLEMRR